MTELRCVTGLGLGQDGMWILTAISEGNTELFWLVNDTQTETLLGALEEKGEGHNGNVCLLQPEKST